MSPTLSESAYEILKNAILSNELAPYTFASDRELCDRFQLSRTPVREAVLRLRDERLVETIPRKGVRVLPLRIEDVRDIHEITKALELEAALIIAERRPSRNDMHAVEVAITAMEAAIEEEDRDAWAIADAAFHFGLVNACGNRRLGQIYHSQRSITDRARHFSLYLRELPALSTQEHRQMLEAVLANEPTLIERLYRLHWERTTSEIVTLLEKHTGMDLLNSAGSFS